MKKFKKIKLKVQILSETLVAAYGLQSLMYPALRPGVEILSTRLRETSLISSPLPVNIGVSKIVMKIYCLK